MLSVKVFEHNILLMILYLNEDTSVRTAPQVSLAAQSVHVHGSATIKPKACWCYLNLYNLKITANSAYYPFPCFSPTVLACPAGWYSGMAQGTSASENDIQPPNSPYLNNGVSTPPSKMPTGCAAVRCSLGHLLAPPQGFQLLGAVFVRAAVHNMNQWVRLGLGVYPNIYFPEPVRTMPDKLFLFFRLSSVRFLFWHTKDALRHT